MANRTDSDTIAYTRVEMDSEFMNFFIDELKDIYWAEKHLGPALKKMKNASTSQVLADAFEKHTIETEEHVSIVEQIFRTLGKEPKTKKCEAMAGLIAEAQSIIEDTEKDSFIRDAGLILAAQKVEHYEIATYGTLRVFAQYIGNDEVEQLLNEILDNEKYTDVSLTKVAEGFINEKAAQE